MQYRLGIFLIASALAGCMPWPHFHYRAPAVEGVVTNNGVPVQNAEINVSAEFSEEQQKGVTDSNGRFSTKPIREFMFFASLLGDPLYGYTVTIINAENQYEGFGGGYVGYAPEQLTVVCDCQSRFNCEAKSAIARVLLMNRMRSHKACARGSGRDARLELAVALDSVIQPPVAPRLP